MPRNMQPEKANRRTVGCTAEAPEGNQTAGDGDMAEFTIYIGNKNYSPWSLRPWLALRHTGAAFEEVMITLDQQDSAVNLRRRSPSGRVPVLGHGALAIWESLCHLRIPGRAIHGSAIVAGGTGSARPGPRRQQRNAWGFAALRDDLPMDINRRWPLGKSIGDGRP